MGKKNKIKLETGTVYQKEEGGTYYFRYQVNGARKAISLKTSEKSKRTSAHRSGNNGRSDLRTCQSGTQSRKEKPPACSERRLESLCGTSGQGISRYTS